MNTSDYVSLVCLNQMIDLVPTEPVYAIGWGQIDSALGGKLFKVIKLIVNIVPNY